MGYFRFLIRQFKTSTYEEIFNQFFDFFGYFLVSAVTIKSSAYLTKFTLYLPAWLLSIFPQLFIWYLLDSIIPIPSIHICQNWRYYTTLWSSCICRNRWRLNTYPAFRNCLVLIHPSVCCLLTIDERFIETSFNIPSSTHLGEFLRLIHVKTWLQASCVLLYFLNPNDVCHL